MDVYRTAFAGEELEAQRYFLTKPEAELYARALLVTYPDSSYVVTKITLTPNSIVRTLNKLYLKHFLIR